MSNPLLKALRWIVVRAGQAAFDQYAKADERITVLADKINAGTATEAEIEEYNNLITTQEN